MDNLPGDLKSRIFHKIPIKNLGSCIFVSKEWLSLIRNTRFVKSYTKANNIPSNKLRVLEEESSRTLELHSDNESFDHLKSLKIPFELNGLQYSSVCNGLFCLVGDRRFVLWNPTIKKTITLPMLRPVSKIKYRLEYGFGFDNTSNDYKVVALEQLGIWPSKSEHVVHIFSLNRKSWRIDAVAAPKYNVIGRSLHFNGFINWLAVDKSCHMVIGFDVSSEVFQVMKFPKVEDHNKMLVTMSVYKEYTIGYIFNTYWGKGEIDVWVMKEYGNADSFTKISSITLFPNERESSYPSPLGFRKNGEIFIEMYMVLPFTTDYNRVIASLDIETGNRTYVATRKEIFSFEVVIHNFVESIVLLDHPQAQSYSIFAVENANDSNDDEDLDFESTSEHLKLNSLMLKPSCSDA